MSLCFRTFSYKLTSFVGQRNQIVQIDHRLNKFISTSTSLQEDYRPTLRKILSHEVPVTSLTYKTIGFNNIGGKLYSSVPQLAKKSCETSVENRYSEAKVKNDNNNDIPDDKQLEHIYQTLQRDLPKFFVSSLDYRIYHRDLEFINNFKGIKTKGINEYIKQVLFLRTTGHVVYAYIKFDVLKITMHPEDNTIKVRWRIRGLSSFRVFTQFWKLRLTDFTKSMESLESWYDGFSTYYVDSNGKVYKHVADKMMPDDETMPVKDKPNIAAKLAA